jgi:hypothetical protein
MNTKVSNFVGVGILVLISGSLRAQVAGATITDPSGATVSNAKGCVKNVASGEATPTNSAGLYAVPNGTPPDCEAAISAESSRTRVSELTSNAAAPSMQRALARAIMAAFSPLGSMAGTERAHLEDGAFSPDQAQGNAQGQAKPPADKPPPPSLGELGFPPEQTAGNPQEQARLDKRTHMLKIHQRLGLITTVPLLATVISGSFAGGRSTSSTNRDLHAALGSVTAGLYLATAYYAIFAPKVPGTPTRGPIRLHKAMAWIHGPGMILTPILGAMAFEQESRGERVHGFAKAHGAVAYVTAAAYGLAIVSVSIKF